MKRTWRAVAGAFAAGLAGAVVLAAPAAADVTVDPTVAGQGGPAELDFTITEERPGAHTTKLELVAPEATPIAEIYPMSVTGWAPVSETRRLAKPIELIHGSKTTAVTSKVTWKRVGRAPVKAGQPTVLTVSLGPMPKAERVLFTIVQTYSDGTVVTWGDEPGRGGAHPAPVVRLLDVAAATAPRAGQPDAGAVAGRTEQGDDGGGPPWIVLAGLVVLAGLAVEGWVLYSVDRRGAGRLATARAK